MQLTLGRKQVGLWRRRWKESFDSLVSIDILDPNRQLKPLFQNYVVHTSDGRVYNGMISEENSNAVRLQQGDGTSRNQLRIQIKTLKSTGVSFMPEVLEKTINEQTMADPLKFLDVRP